jgi:hypothetical protein
LFYENKRVRGNHISGAKEPLTKESMLDLKYWITDARNVSATLLRMGLDISVIRHGVPVLALVTDDGLLRIVMRGVTPRKA